MAALCFLILHSHSKFPFLFIFNAVALPLPAGFFGVSFWKVYFVDDIIDETVSAGATTVIVLIGKVISFNFWEIC